MKISNNQKMRPFMKVILIILLVVVIGILTPLFAVNITTQIAKNNRSLPPVPFSQGLYYCPISKEIAGSQYKTGSMLILKSYASYKPNQQIFVRNKYYYNLSSIDHTFLICNVKSVEKDSISVTICGEDELLLSISPTAIIGMVKKELPYGAGIYNALNGMKGILLFGVIPVLFLLLTFFVFKIITISSQSRKNGLAEEMNIPTLDMDISDLLGKSPPPTTPQNVTETVTPPQEKIVPTAKVTETVTTIESNPIEKVDIAETVIPDNEDTAPTKIYPAKKEETVPTQAEVRGLYMIDKENANRDINEIKQRNEQMKDLFPQDKNPPKAVAKTAETKEKFLSADEIIALYREEHSNTIRSELARKKDEKLNDLAQLYYDNDLEHYDK